MLSFLYASGKMCKIGIKSLGKMCKNNTKKSGKMCKIDIEKSGKMCYFIIKRWFHEAKCDFRACSMEK